MQTLQKKISLLILAVLSALALPAPSAQAAKYTIDPAHSNVDFKVRHLMVNKVSGRFERFSGEFNYDEKLPQSWTALAKIEAASVNTGNADRDTHLRGADFLDAGKFPVIAFRTTSVTDVANGRAKLNGVLSLHGVEKPVTLDLEIGGVVDDPWGNTKAGFTATGKINRNDYGIVWNKTFGNGGLVVGEEVEITLQIEGTQIKETAPAPEDKKKKKEKKK